MRMCARVCVCYMCVCVCYAHMHIRPIRIWDIKYAYMHMGFPYAYVATFCPTQVCAWISFACLITSLYSCYKSRDKGIVAQPKVVFIDHVCAFTPHACACIW